MSGPEGYPPSPGDAPRDPHGRPWMPPGSQPAPQAPGEGGWQAPGQGGWQAPGQGGWQAPGQQPWQQPGLVGAAHKPGAVPLRPLRLGDVYDAAFKIIRHNPKATVGSAALVAAVAMAIPVLVTVLLVSLVGVGSGFGEFLGTPSTGPGSGPAQQQGVSDEEVAGMMGAFGSLVVGSFLQWVGAVLVTGMIAHVTMAAALGRTMGLGEAWAATRGRRARLLGLVLVLTLIPFVGLVAYAALWVPVVVYADAGLAVAFGLVTVPLVIAMLAFYYIRVQYLAVPPMMLEGAGIGGTLRRAFRLSSGQFWRLFGIALLTAVITGIAGSILALPVTVVQQILFVTLDDGQALILVSVLGQALGSVLAAAFVTPFTAAVASLLYLDQRIRKEGFDVELLSAAGIPAGPAGGQAGAWPGGGPTGAGPR